MAIETAELEAEELKEEELEDEDIEESEESSSDDSSYSPLYGWYDPSLAIYLREISRFPLLEREEEKALTLKIVETQVLLNTNTLTESEREKTNAELESSKSRMIRSNLRLVVKIATIYWRIVEGKMGLVDLIQEGSIGLMRAVEEFNPYKGFRFSTYAYPWIRQKITRAIAEKANIIRLPVHVVTRLGKVKKAMERIEEGGGVASVDSLAEVLGEHYSDDRVRKIIEVQKLQNPVSLNAILSSDEKGGKSREFGDFIRDSELSPEKKALNNITREEIRAVLEQLNEKEREVIKLRFGLSDGTERTLQEIGDILGISRERVRQIQEIALKKLRRPDRARRLKKLEIEGILEE